MQHDVNVGSNHFVHCNLRGDGVHYWDNHDYSEQGLRTAAGYKKQNARQSWRVIPFVEQNWLGGLRYSVCTARIWNTAACCHCAGS
ncbi:surface lipoprotein assembly modifier [Neisseria iguanae]|uniref:surface lipoprotein assembly modifier n=1 Tax=Neisseria iguanae TaxID=90242 RepID=UPI001FE8B99F|nr:surface lipoprotein assembly modifier [Neisseria iguanae]